LARLELVDPPKCLFPALFQLRSNEAVVGIACRVASFCQSGFVASLLVIVAEVERLRWRIWNGKAKNAQRSIKRIRKVMHAFQGERGQRARSTPSGKLWSALHEVDSYLSGQSAWLVNYAKRYRAGLRVGTSITEGTANFLINRRMNKSQQMRWSRHGADLLLQVRCAVYNGTRGTGLGHRFEVFVAPNPMISMAVMISLISGRSRARYDESDDVGGIPGSVKQAVAALVELLAAHPAAETAVILDGAPGPHRNSRRPARHAPHPSRPPQNATPYLNPVSGDQTVWRER
jgi:hypothetical protein